MGDLIVCELGQAIGSMIAAEKHLKRVLEESIEPSMEADRNLTFFVHDLLGTLTKMVNTVHVRRKSLLQKEVKLGE